MFIKHARVIGWGVGICTGLYLLWILRPAIAFLEPEFYAHPLIFLLTLLFFVALGGWSVGRRFYGILSGKESVAQAMINPQQGDPSHKFHKRTSVLLMTLLLLSVALLGFWIVLWSH